MTGKHGETVTIERGLSPSGMKGFVFLIKTSAGQITGWTLYKKTAMKCVKRYLKDRDKSLRMGQSRRPTGKAQGTTPMNQRNPGWTDSLVNSEGRIQ